ncbi:hypothetical protein [Rhodococcoides fascians]|uniref:hypothetical protein n=1 Tax=Rhodococcoides fascians TaxID=1828 RepID=UPI001E4C0E58|nr:hypothetical protein [Rhodococcus fascians]
MMNEDDYASYIALGQKNARIMDLATNHCQSMRFIQSGGQGMLEEATGLPLNSRRIECQVVIGDTSGMQLEHIAFDFYTNHCIGCAQRNPTGRLPNLGTKYQQDRAEAQAQEAEAAQRRRDLGVLRTARIERRRSLRATADPAAANILDDLDILDTDPEADPDPEEQNKARQRLTAVAGRAHERFDDGIIDELFDAVETIGIVEVLEPLRHLSAKQPDLAKRLVATAIGVLKYRASLEAGRCLSDHPTQVTDDRIDGNTIRNAAVIAGSKTPDDHHFSGPNPVIAANDPGPVRVLADLAPDLVKDTLAAMLPRPQNTGLILAPSIERPRASDFDRRAAAGAIEHLAATHFDLAVALLPNLATSLGVPPSDSYDTGTMGSAERTLARILIADPARVAPLFEQAGQYASEDIRKGLIGSARHAVNMVDPDNMFRRPHDPVIDDSASQAVIDTAFAFFIAHTDESWGHDVTFEACEAIENISHRRSSNALQPHIDTTLGAFIALTHHRLKAPTQRLETTAEPDRLAGLKAYGRLNSLYQGSRRLLRMVEQAAVTDPVAVCATICATVTVERDNNLGVEVLMPLLETLGDIGRRYGDEPGVLQAILPTLHTYLVDADQGLRSSAVKAWTEIGSRHPVPSTVSDLLPALVNDPYIVMIDAVLKAATRLTWTRVEDKVQLAVYASHLAANLELPGRLELVLTALSALRRHVPNLDALATLERAALARIPELEWHEASKVIQQRWQADARVTTDLARQWLTDAPRHTYGIRQHDEAEEALNGLLDCGIGLLGNTDKLIDVGARHSPESHYGALEYAEVLARVESRDAAVKLLQDAYNNNPDNEAHATQRALTNLALTTAKLHTTLTSRDANNNPTNDPAVVTAALDDLATALQFSQALTGDDKQWLQPFQHATATRAATVCDLLNLPYPDAVAAVLARQNVTAYDPAEQVANRADRLREHAKALRNARKSSGTATHRGLNVTTQLLEAVAHHLGAEAADLNADLAQAQAHRTAAQRRAAAIDLTDFRLDDPLLMRARELRATLAASNDPLEVATITNQAAQLPTPLLFIRSSEHTRTRGRPWISPADPEPESPNVAVALVYIDDKLLTGPAIIDPNLTHTLTLNVQTDPWPAWATRLDAELISTLNHAELERPALTWTRNEHTGDPQTFEGTGSLHIRYSVPTQQHAPPVLIRLTWRGADTDGNPVIQDLDVAGHREIRVRPYDHARDATTEYEVFDERLHAIYENLASAGYPYGHIQAFARLLNAISRIGLSMTWNKKYRRGHHIRERDFHNDLHTALLADPTLEGRVERGTPLALGFLDTRHDGITAELKVARDQPVTSETAPKYIGQPTQYAAADGTRLSILVILDMSRKLLPIGTPENYLFVLTPQQHGMTEPHSPSVVVTLVINGNLPVPSSWSRRKTPTVETSPSGPEGPATA